MKPPTIGGMQLAPLVSLFAFCGLAWMPEWLGVGRAVLIPIAGWGIILSCLALFAVSAVTSVRYWQYRRWLRRRVRGAHG